jgi:hypothetical protein
MEQLLHNLLVLEVILMWEIVLTVWFLAVTGALIWTGFGVVMVAHKIYRAVKR